MGAIQLIRHGQASFGSDDYDQLSELGTRQSAALGAAWEAGDYRPTWSVAGSMKRHAQTAIAVIDEIDGDLYDVNDGWNEYDHLALAGSDGTGQQPEDPRVFQRTLDTALAQWVRGEIESGESFNQFRSRVLGAFGEAVDRSGRGLQTAVFTSGGPISLIVSQLLMGDASLFIKLNRVVINASVTTVINGPGGTRLLTFNEHTHLPSAWQTFR